MGLATHPALAATLCVGGSGCYTSIQQALDHAQNGDTIRIDPGTFAGGVTISASVSLMGAGAGKTIIQGGRATPTAPVIRIGIYLAASEPSVSISGVTITGGNNTSDTDPFDDSGGGIKVEPPVGATAGTIRPAGTITIMNSVITGNSVLSLGGESCGSGPTPTCFSAVGGGISNFGSMTLFNTTVSNNTASWNVSPASDFDYTSGGGIANAGLSTLTLRNSTVSGNTVSFSTAVAAQGDFAFGGGADRGWRRHRDT